MSATRPLNKYEEIILKHLKNKDASRVNILRDLLTAYHGDYSIPPDASYGRGLKNTLWKASTARTHADLSVALDKKLIQIKATIKATQISTHESEIKELDEKQNSSPKKEKFVLNPDDTLIPIYQMINEYKPTKEINASGDFTSLNQPIRILPPRFSACSCQPTGLRCRNSSSFSP